MIMLKQSGSKTHSTNIVDPKQYNVLSRKTLAQGKDEVLGGQNGGSGNVNSSALPIKRVANNS